MNKDSSLNIDSIDSDNMKSSNSDYMSMNKNNSFNYANSNLAMALKSDIRGFAYFDYNNNSFGASINRRKSDNQLNMKKNKSEMKNNKSNMCESLNFGESNNNAKLYEPNNKAKLSNKNAKLDVPTNNAKLHVPTNNAKLDIPNNNVKLSNNNEKLDVQTNNAKLDIQNNNAQLDVPTNNAKLDVLTNNANLDVPTNNAKLDVLTNDAKLDLPNNNAKIYEPNNKVKLDVAKDNNAKLDGSNKQINKSEKMANEHNNHANTSTDYQSNYLSYNVTPRYNVQYVFIVRSYPTSRQYDNFDVRREFLGSYYNINSAIMAVICDIHFDIKMISFKMSQNIIMYDLLSKHLERKYDFIEMVKRIQGPAHVSDGHISYIIQSSYIYN